MTERDDKSYSEGYTDGVKDLKERLISIFKENKRDCCIITLEKALAEATKEGDK
jgi:hypothetical protein